MREIRHPVAVKCAVGPCQRERIAGTSFCSEHGPVPELAHGYEFPIEHPNFGVRGFLELDETVTQAIVDSFWDAWPRDDQSFEALKGEEANVLVVEFSLDLGDDRGNTTNTAKAFAEARHSVVHVAAQAGLAGRLRPLEGYTVGYDWFESVSPHP